MLTPNNQNIIIQEVNDHTITVNVNGEIQEIQNQLSEVKNLLQNFKTPTIQYAEKIYNIEHIDEANFGFVMGKKSFNELLTKRLIEVIAPYSSDAQKVLDYVTKNQVADWESQAKFAKKAKEIIAYSLVGVLGVQFSKLIAIGNEENTDAKQRKYIEKCLYIAKRSLDLIEFTLLSTLWDFQKQGFRPISPAQSQLIQAFFTRSFEPGFRENLHFLQNLQTLLTENQIPFPFPEVANFADYLAESHPFHQACLQMQALSNALDKENYTLLECSEAEKNLATFFEYVGFLANYKMASIKHIGYKHSRNTTPHYLHRYASLGIDNKANIDAEKYNYTPKTVATDAVLIYQGDNYQKSINLFPFVIDYNSLTFENGVKICFFHSLHISDSSLDYIFLEDNSVYNIVFENISAENPDFNELIADKEKHKIFNLDNVVVGFQEAQTNILGKVETPQDDFEGMFS
ncbi:MAG: hypothetical protein MUE85_07265 [Microscillaceae bacterium]|jgi:hypothetical protein|nr:hypothetical protein [Microscillaceae bacterium]